MNNAADREGVAGSAALRWRADGDPVGASGVEQDAARSFMDQASATTPDRVK